MLTVEKLEKIAELIDATAEILGSQIKPQIIKIMCDDLSDYEFNDIQAALTACRREVKGRLSLKDIIDRLPKKSDELPTADELWGEVLDYCQSEYKTFVLPELAFKACENAMVYELVNDGDKIAARMAFKAAYERLSQGFSGSLKYRYSLGTNKAMREEVLKNAIKQGKLNNIDCAGLLDYKSQTFVGLIEKIEENTQNGDYTLSEKGKNALQKMTEILQKRF